MASLESLPAEIVLQLFSHFTDLKTLFYLAMISPNVRRVFDLFGPEVMERIICAESTSPELRNLIRLVAAARMSTVSRPFSRSFKALKRKYLFWRIDSTDVSQKLHAALARPAPSLTRSFRRRVVGSVWKFLLTAHRIARLTPVCLAYYHDRCMEITPSRLVDENHSSLSEPKPWRRRYSGVQYTPQDIGPPKWEEEQRVMCGFCAFELFLETKAAGSEGRLAWPADDLEALASCSAGDFMPSPTDQELLTAAHFIGHLRERRCAKANGTGNGTSKCTVTKDSYTTWPDPIPKPEYYAKIRKCVSPVSADGIEPLWARYQWVSVPIAPDIHKSAKSIEFARALTNNEQSPIRFHPLSPFSELGFAIWEGEKLERLSLYHNSNDAKLPEPFLLGNNQTDQHFRWRSLLGEDILAEVENKMEAEWERSHCKKPTRKKQEEGVWASAAEEPNPFIS